MADALRSIGAIASAQLVSRAVTFGLNVLTARLAAPTSYGITYVSFQLFSNLSLFLPKEGFRKVALRRQQQNGETTHDDGQTLQSAVNLGWCSALFAVAVTLPLAAYWVTTKPDAAPPTYTLGVALMAMASVLEAFGEPFLISALMAFDFGSRAWGEAVALLSRTVVMCLLTLVHGDLVLAFALSQLLYSVIWVVWLAQRAGKAAWPARGPGGELVAAEHRALLVEFGGMAVLKLLLTEGEKVLLLALFTERDWGVFGLVSNFGSIILRLLFAPIEEVAYSAFTAPAPVQKHWGLLRSLLLIQGGVGWLGACFGPGFSQVAIRILYGSEWAASPAPRVLAAYCLLLFCMAANGVLEAFMYAQCTASWVSTCRRAQLATSLVLLAGAWFGRQQGPAALVWANAAAMVCRIALCVVFARKHLGIGWTDLRARPVLELMGMLALAGALSSFAVPAVGPDSALPLPRAAMAIGIAGLSIVLVGALYRQELRGAVSAVRVSKNA